jgi:hypothetical protein
MVGGREKAGACADIVTHLPVTFCRLCVYRNSAHVKEIIHGAIQRKALPLLLLLLLLLREKLKKCTVLKAVSVRPYSKGASVRECW